MSWLVFVGAFLAIPVLGFGAAFHPTLQLEPPLTRIAGALGFGAIALTLSGLLPTFVGIAWSLPALAAPPLAVSAAAAALWRRRPAEAPPPFRPGRAVALASGVVVALALALLARALMTSTATSVDYLYFWGVKAAHFADERAVAVPLLKWIRFRHAVPDYPPLVPIVEAWSALAAGEMPWRGAPLTAFFWLAAVLPLMRSLLRRRISDDATAAVAAVWTAALAASATRTHFGGNAEGPLLFFETVALAALLTERPLESRFLPGLMLCGAVLTKVEGTVAALLVVGAVAIRDALERRPRALARAARLAMAPAGAVSCWFLFQYRFGLRPGFRSHGDFLAVRTEFLAQIAKAFPIALDAGTFALPWIFVVLVLLLSRPRLSTLQPALALVAGIARFLVFDYTHDVEDPTVRIGWTAPRVTQPALSVGILAAALASFDATARRRGRASTAAAVAAARSEIAAP